MQASYFTLNGMFFPIKGMHDPNTAWNGFAVPYFAKADAKLIAGYLRNAEDADYDGTYYDVEGDDIIEVEVDGGVQVRNVMQPSVDGLYCLGGYCWTWQEVKEINPNTTIAMAIEAFHSAAHEAMNNGKDINVMRMEWDANDRRDNGRGEDVWRVNFVIPDNEYDDEIWGSFDYYSADDMEWDMARLESIVDDELVVEL